MPYCPKCDMEFVDGITTCSDCGGDLVESQEAYEAAMREKKKQQQIDAASGRYLQTDGIDASEIIWLILTTWPIWKTWRILKPF